MFKPATLDLEGYRQATGPQPEVVNKLFKVLHGYYGNLFLSKFATGQVEQGEDQGVANARRIWAFGLRDFDGGTVKTALARCQAAHPEFPPSLPQFVALCKACQPREAVQRGPVALGMGQELRSAYVARARAAATARLNTVLATKVGFVDAGDGLDGLKRCIANAVACAGGDEVAEMLRLDRMFAPRVAA